MRINSVLPNVAFQRNLTSKEVKEYSAVLEQGKQLVGQNGKSIFIMPSSCLPQTSEFNSGIGHLSSDIAQDYLKYMKTYLGFNIVEDLPAGQIPNNNRYYCAYKGSALALGNQQINPELLVTEQFGQLLTKEDLQEIADANTSLTKSELSNFHNVMDANGAQNRILKRAFEKFKQLDDTSSLKKEFKQYVEENKDWLNIPRYDEPDKQFFQFKQFLADEHLKIAKQKLNQNGMKLCGDCMIGFSRDEKNAFPNAFMKDAYIGASDWKAPALNYDKILDPKSDAYKLLKRKIQLCAKRYDIVRIDAAWLYVAPPIKGKNGNVTKNMGSELLNLIENWVREVKGSSFDLKDIIYEFEAMPTDFKAFEHGELIKPLKDRVKIYTSQYMHAKPDDNWGFTRAFLEKKFSPEEFILGVGNHDTQPLRQVANGIENEVKRGLFEVYKQDSITALAKELQLSPQDLQNPVNFAKAKWAEPMQAKNMMMFYWDVLGRNERFDGHWQKDFAKNAHINYALKVPTDYKTAYQQGLQNGYGFNPMDALEKLFIKKGLNHSHPDLFAKIVNFKNILTNPQEYIKDDNMFTKYGSKIIFAAVGILGIAAIYKHFTNQNKPKELPVIQDTSQPKDITPIGRFYSFNEFTKK